MARKQQRGYKTGKQLVTAPRIVIAVNATEFVNKIGSEARRANLIRRPP